MANEACQLPPLADGSDRTCLIEFRAPMVADGLDNPFIVTWTDPTGIVRAMQPRFGDTLLTLNTTTVQEGSKLTLMLLLDTFRVYFIVLTALLGCMVALFVWACFRLRHERGKKAKYVLDTRQYRTIDGHYVSKHLLKSTTRRTNNRNATMATTTTTTPATTTNNHINAINAKKKNAGDDDDDDDEVRRRTGSQRSKTKELAIHQDNRIHWFHWVYIALVFGVQAAMTLMFTITFYALLFYTVNTQHFDVLKQYPSWARNRDAQLSTVLSAVEAHYKTEIELIETQYASLSTVCQSQVSVMQSAYDVEQQRIRQFHDDQFRNPPAGASDIDVISTTYACNTQQGSGAVYERDNIAHSYEIIRQDGSSRIVTWRLLPSDTRENILSNVTFWCTKVHWCKGYSYDETNKHYYLFKHLPSPHLPPTDNNDNNNNNNKNSSSN
uniref:Uncharacterized protein n=1 Tax=Lotharella globosa TaxID=91324 RepID=A0A7S4DSP3_9EUKA